MTLRTLASKTVALLAAGLTILASVIVLLVGGCWIFTKKVWSGINRVMG